MITYRTYQIGQAAGNHTFFVLNCLGQDLFYGIKTMAEAKQTVDNWITAVKVLG